MPEHPEKQTGLAWKRTVVYMLYYNNYNKTNRMKLNRTVENTTINRLQIPEKGDNALGSLPSRKC